MKCHLHQNFALFSFKSLLNHFTEGFSGILQKVLGSLQPSLGVPVVAGSLGAILLLSDLPPALVFVVSTTHCLTEGRSGSNQNSGNCPLQIDFSVKTTGFDILPRLSNYCVQSQINRTKYFFLAIPQKGELFCSFIELFLLVLVFQRF